MASMFCSKCGEEIEVPASNRRPFITCPKCKNAIQVSASQPSRAQPSAPARPQPQPQQPTAQARPQAPTNQFAPSPGGNALPETMKANKRVAGQLCNICSQPINLGEQIHNCPACHSINHDACWRQSGGCTSASCSTFQAPAAPQRSSIAPAPAGNTVPCRWCKEPIVRGARKCKHCDEFQRDSDRDINANNSNAPIDSALTTTDWIGILCCPIIGFIQGAVYATQGDPKGKKLMLYSAISMAIGAVIKSGSR